MKRNKIRSQLNNYKTTQMYLRQCLTLAENVFEFPGLPKYIDTAYFNKILLRNGAIAFFYDEILDQVLALPFVNYGKVDVYGRPTSIQVQGQNGYTRVLKPGEFVIMYDNNGRYPLFLDISQYANRLALCQRTIDINIGQQRTPRFWKTTSEKEKSVRDIVDSVDSDLDTVVTYDDIDLDDTTIVLSPAPYVADKVDQNKEKIWNEFLRLIGVSNLSFEKKERNIKDEIQAMQGGTVASRFSRFEPRQKAVEQINEMFGKYLDEEIQVKYYDGLPSSAEELESNEEVYEDDTSIL